MRSPCKRIKITLTESSRGISFSPSTNNIPSSPRSGPSGKINYYLKKNLMINYLKVLEILILYLHWSLMAIKCFVTCVVAMVLLKTTISPKMIGIQIMVMSVIEKV